jgi:hypothetical protein
MCGVHAFLLQCDSGFCIAPIRCPLCRRGAAAALSWRIAGVMEKALSGNFIRAFFCRGRSRQLARPPPAACRDARRRLMSKTLPEIYRDWLEVNAWHNTGDDFATSMKAIHRTRGLPKLGKAITGSCASPAAPACRKRSCGLRAVGWAWRGQVSGRASTDRREHQSDPSVT